MAVARRSIVQGPSLALLLAILSVALATMVAYRLLVLPVPHHGIRPASGQATQVQAVQQSTDAAVAPARQEQAPVTTAPPVGVSATARPGPVATPAQAIGNHGDTASRVVSPPGGLGGLCSPQKNCQ